MQHRPRIPEIKLVPGAEHMWNMAVPKDVVPPNTATMCLNRRSMSFQQLMEAVGTFEFALGGLDEGVKSAIRDFVDSVPAELIELIIASDIGQRYKIWQIYMAELMAFEYEINRIQSA